jgi:hypothetical protein
VTIATVIVRAPGCAFTCGSSQVIVGTHKPGRARLAGFGLRACVFMESRTMKVFRELLSVDPAELNPQALACWRSELNSDPMHLPGVQDGTAPAGRGFRLAACNFAFDADRCSFLGEDPPVRCPLPATECGSDDASRSSNNRKRKLPCRQLAWAQTIASSRQPGQPRTHRPAMVEWRTAAARARGRPRQERLARPLTGSFPPFPVGAPKAMTSFGPTHSGHDWPRR